MEDYDGKRIEYRDTMDYKAGYIFYYKGNGYNLAKRFNKVTYNGKTIIYKIEPLLIIDDFQADSTRK